ncbi:STAS domain-containing protein [Streptomyces sp. NPDC059759]|uniref:STAS domain-containing protein n=1 Tax=Streptomyces sp. NPDC059759 TaxID=3346936 RepID=UPI00364890E2
MDLPCSDAVVPLHVVDARLPGAYLLTLRGDTHSSCTSRLEEAFHHAAADGGPLIVDLGGLGFGDETLLGLLLDARGIGPVHLAGPISAAFQRRLDVTGTADIFTIHPDLSQALAAFAP